MLKKIIKEIFKCRHKNAALHGSEGYCPDCGKYVRKAYYVVRCECCGIKRVAKRSFDNITPTEKYCTNCGSTEYKVERYEKLNLVDIAYAIEVKETSQEFGETESIEIWIEDGVNIENKGGLEISPALIPSMKYITG